MATSLNHNQTFSTPQEALAHYGVKGMKWGVRKSDETSKGTVGTSDEAMLAAYAVVIAGILVRKARMSYVDSGKREAKAINKQERKTGVKHEWKRNDSLSGPKTHEELLRDIVPAINKGYPSERGTSMNCRRCTFAYEMRRRGYDVKATKSLYATGQTQAGLHNATSPKESNQSITPPIRSPWGRNTIPTTVNGRSMTPEGKSAAIFDRLSREPNGSRGELAFSWAFGGGHSIAYEIVNNKPVIFDTQSSRSWSDKGPFAMQVTPIMGTVAFTRLDNVDLNSDIMKRWVADA